MIYLSYPMTNAPPGTQKIVGRMRSALKKAGITFYDPINDEETGATIAALQNADFEAMRRCTALVVVWCAGAPESKGVNAELEWAARCFQIPIYVWQPEYAPYFAAWPWATIHITAGQHVFHTPKEIINVFVR